MAYSVVICSTRC